MQQSLPYPSHYRRMVPQLLQTLEFRSNNAVHRPLIDALELLKRYAKGGQRLYPAREKVPLHGVVPPAIEELVVRKDAKGKQRVDRINYEICVLRELRERLRCKEIWVVGADRYRNPDEDLPQDFEIKRDSYYAELGQPRDVELFITGLQNTMRETLDALDRGLPRNPSAKIQPNGRIVVSPLEALPEPVHLVDLKDELVVRWPMTSLLDILKETDLRVGITRHFTSLTAHESLDPEALQRRLLLCLYGLGTNAGLKRVANGDHAWRKRRRPALRVSPLRPQGAAAPGGRRCRQRDIPREASRYLGRGHHRVRLGQQEVRGLGPEPADRVACALPRAGRDDLPPYLAVGLEPNSKYVVAMYTTDGSETPTRSSLDHAIGGSKVAMRA